MPVCVSWGSTVWPKLQVEAQLSARQHSEPLRLPPGLRWEQQPNLSVRVGAPHQRVLLFTSFTSHPHVVTCEALSHVPSTVPKATPAYRGESLPLPILDCLVLPWKTHQGFISPKTQSTSPQPPERAGRKFLRQEVYFGHPGHRWERHRAPLQNSVLDTALRRLART